jgi:hypothetical protein
MSTKPLAVLQVGPIAENGSAVHILLSKTGEGFTAQKMPPILKPHDRIEPACDQEGHISQKTWDALGFGTVSKLPTSPQRLTDSAWKKPETPTP